ncbi:MAG TPA: hypothetical protein VF506_06750 [Streptosporangiaceae bacterium]
MADHVAVIRTAANLMRDRARAVTRPDDRWTYMRPSPAAWSPGHEMHVAAVGDPQWSGMADVIVGTSAAPHIAGWPPVVALAVADMLDGAADREEAYLASQPCGRPTGGEGCVCGEPEPGDEAALALAVARAYLGRPPEVGGG